MNIREMRSEWYRSEYAKNDLPMMVTGQNPRMKIDTSTLTRYKNMIKNGEVTEVAFNNFFWPCGEHWWPERFVVLQHSPPENWIIMSNAFLDRAELAKVLNTEEVRIRVITDTTIEYNYRVN